MTARAAADLLEIQPNTTTLFYHKVCLVIIHHLSLQADDIFDDQVELDKNYFGGHQRKTRKHRGYEEQRGKILISNPLEACPRTAEKRLRLGHWELDTVLGKAGKACLMTANDRKSRFTIANKSTKAVVEALISAFKGYHLPVTPY